MMIELTIDVKLKFIESLLQRADAAQYDDKVKWTEIIFTNFYKNISWSFN